MKRKIIAAVCCALCIFLLSSCQLARESAGTKTFEDRMIGVFITSEHLDLFDFESYLNDNLNRFSGGEILMSGDTKNYQGRLYATLTTVPLTNKETGEQTETQEYIFVDIEGISYFSATIPAALPEGDSYISSTSDEAITDGHMSIAERDEGRTTTLEGTIFVIPTVQNRAYYLNPVYQSEDGSVYLTAGTGLSAPMDYEGARMSQSMDSTATVTENGETTKDSLSITVSISVMSIPEKIVILQMDTDNTILTRTEYDPDKMPDELMPGLDTEYFIVEYHNRSVTGEQSVVREIYGSDTESIEYFIARADGICVKRWMRLEWTEQSVVNIQS